MSDRSWTLMRSDPTMSDMRLNRISGLAIGGATGRIRDWTPPRRDPPDLILARQAMVRHRLGDAERHLRRALDTAPDSAEVRTLMGLLHERVGEHHAAYQCYRLALLLDRRDPVASDGLRRYCQRFGFDPGNKAINPAVGDPA
jgi:tetratricopeptide (TPR) repeat protein